MSVRARGMAAWRPQSHTIALLEEVRAILEEYAEHLPLTLRQVFYRLVGVHGYDKTEQAYGRLGEALNRARRAGIIPWTAIRDDGWQLHAPQSWDTPEELAEAFIVGLRHFRLDRQADQPSRLLIAVEAAGMLPQIQQIAEPYGIPCYASGGFDSSTAKYELAEQLAAWGRAEVLHVGDHDPSGVHLFVNLAEDVSALAEALGAGDRLGLGLQFSRLAVTPEQIEGLGLPTAPAKPTDRRRFDGETVQVEAIPPDVLADIIAEAIAERIDQEAYAKVLAAERKIQSMTRAEIAGLIRRLPEGGGAP